jgi:hypothetical protein
MSDNSDELRDKTALLSQFTPSPANLDELVNAGKLNVQKLSEMDPTSLEALLESTSLRNPNSTVPPMPADEMRRLLNGLSARDPKVVDEVRQLLGVTSNTTPPAA